MNDLKNRMQQKCDTLEATHFKDKEIQENIIPSIDKLKEWSGKQKCSVIFDTKIDGYDGGVLKNKVINKKNLYFIHFNNKNNVFGGYVDNIIDKTRSWIKDSNAFLFSLIRNGEMKNIKYNIKRSKEQYAFYLDVSDYLYMFGSYTHSDIAIWRNNSSKSYCSPYSCGYNGENDRFVDNSKFTTKRILVVQMN
ncbi:TLDc domain-containing protein [Entamoeba marina]